MSKTILNIIGNWCFLFYVHHEWLFTEIWFGWHIPSTSTVTIHLKTFHHSIQVLSLLYMHSPHHKQWLCDTLVGCSPVHQLQCSWWGQMVSLGLPPRMICTSFQFQQSSLTCRPRTAQILTGEGKVHHSPNHYWMSCFSFPLASQSSGTDVRCAVSVICVTDLFQETLLHLPC